MTVFVEQPLALPWSAKHYMDWIGLDWTMAPSMSMCSPLPWLPQVTNEQLTKKPRGWVENLSTISIASY